MCNRACIEFGRVVIKKDEVNGKGIIEVGSCDVNGSLRSVIEPLKPRKYVGVDVAEGPGVDQIGDATNLFQHFDFGSFDMLIATEVLEHVKDWRKAITNFKHLIRTGGVLVITVPSIGCGFHGYPEDHWRFQISDMKAIFSDFIIEELWQSPSIEGVFLKAKKPANLMEFDTSNYKLYSIMKRRRTRKNRGVEILLFKIQLFFRILRKTPLQIKYLLKGSSIYEVATWINHPPPNP